MNKPLGKKIMASILWSVCSILSFIVLVGIIGGCSKIREKDMQAMTTEQKIDYILGTWNDKRRHGEKYKVLDKTITNSGKDKKQKNIFIKIKTPDVHKNTMLTDTKELAGQFAKISEVYTFAVNWEADVLNQYGNEFPVCLGKLSFENAVFRKINWANVPPEQLPHIANQYTEHPQLSKE